jgi:hypothetical protein
VSYTDTFGAPRDGHTHEGQDLMGKKLQPLLAVADGEVCTVKFANGTGNYLSIRVDSDKNGIFDWTFNYLHVNNDTPGTDDAKATREMAFPDDIVTGAKVKKGQVVGYLGDSGNAENVGAHLHFEARVYDRYCFGTPVNPYTALQKATRPATKDRWWLRRSVSAGLPRDVFEYGGVAGDQPLSCDFDGDGIDQPVIFRAGVWWLRSGTVAYGTAAKLTFGADGDRALCGDLDGDGNDEAILFRNGLWTVRTGAQPADTTNAPISYGTTGDLPVVGDWNGDGTDDFAVVRGGMWYLRSSGGPAGAAIVHFPYGRAADLPTAVDWNANGVDEPGVYRDGTWYLRDGVAATGAAGKQFVLGSAGDRPVVGSWTAKNSPSVGVYRLTVPY